MVVSHYRCDFGQGGMLRDHIGTDVWVTAHDLPFFFCQRAWLVQDVIANTDLSQIVQ
jgi:hypothetical protein